MSYFMTGRDDELDIAKKFTKQFLKKAIFKGFLLIKGNMGIGKSLFLRKLLDVV